MRGLRGGAGKRGDEVSLDDLRAFGISADQLATTTAQDEREWLKMAGQGAERFMAKWFAAENVGAGLRHAIVSMPGRDGKDQDRILQSNNRHVRAGLLAIVD